MNLFDFKQIRNFDFQILFYAFLLCIIGSATIFSTTYFPKREPSELFFNQIAFYLAGFVVMSLITLVNYKALLSARNQIILFIINIGLLLAVLAIGETVYDAKRWINLGSFSLQPSEIAKIILVLNLAFVFSKFFQVIKHRKSIKEKIIEYSKNNFVRLIQINFVKFYKFGKAYKLFDFGVLALVVFLPIGLIMLQNSLGNSLLIAFIAGLMTYYRFGINKFFISIILGSILGILSSLGWSSILVIQFDFLGSFVEIDLAIILISITIFYIANKLGYKFLILFFGLVIGVFFLPTISNVYNFQLQPYQKSRIENFINPKEDSAEYWNRNQSMIACGSGGMIGKGFLEGTQSNYKLLPFAFTDFAYCAYVEQFGFVGSVILILIYALLFLRILRISERTEELFGKLIANGMIFVILLNMVQHMGMNLGILPITGVPLPLISYGGSAILTVFIALGFVQSINANKTNKVPVVEVIDRL